MFVVTRSRLDVIFSLYFNNQQFPQRLYVHIYICKISTGDQLRIYETKFRTTRNDVCHNESLERDHELRFCFLYKTYTSPKVFQLIKRNMQGSWPMGKCLWWNHDSNVHWWVFHKPCLSWNWSSWYDKGCYSRAFQNHEKPPRPSPGTATVIGAFSTPGLRPQRPGGLFGGDGGIGGGRKSGSRGMSGVGGGRQIGILQPVPLNAPDRDLGFTSTESLTQVQLYDLDRHPVQKSDNNRWYFLQIHLSKTDTIIHVEHDPWYILVMIDISTFHHLNVHPKT